MVGCSAKGCKNRSDSGILMKSFPRDPQRRALWAAQVNRKNWFPTDTSRLCEDHFDANQWEKPKVDGKRLLKSTAIPTLFGDDISRRTTADDHEILASVLSASQKEPEMEHDYSAKPSGDNPNNYLVIVVPNDPKKTLPNPSHSDLECLMEGDEPRRERMEILEDHSSEMLKEEVANVKNVLAKAKKEKKLKIMRFLKKPRSEDVLAGQENAVSRIRKIFNKDQLNFIIGGDRPRRFHWSEETLRKAGRLRLACGPRGYDEIIRQGLPFPDARYLKRKVKELLIKQQLLQEMQQQEMREDEPQAEEERTEIYPQVLVINGLDREEDSMGQRVFQEQDEVDMAVSKMEFIDAHEADMADDIRDISHISHLSDVDATEL